ncbi:carboxymuconolactone decarboxylase family protein [Sphingomonas hylomeconis]|uniref:Carboxymuconolactone decarboxylase family protein n=1 Tax=Sphingomonas hylomeconis TaxID=1395958 RepID=A0ABV7SUE5_9SPHN|nr:carboxymuconolactone decarboxylase family protein [Sphingomonas hylomeconis]
MTQRLDIFTAAPEGAKAMIALEAAIAGSGLERSLIELVKLRASQINGCAYCLHMHVADAVKAGETDLRIHLLNAWRESMMFTARERAALNWTEVLTTIAGTGAPDADYALLAAQFDEREQGFLSLLIGTINAWNRLQVGFRGAHPGDVAPRAAAPAQVS